MNEQEARALLLAGTIPLDLPHWGTCAGVGRWEAVHGFDTDEDDNLVRRRCPCCIRPIECQPCLAVTKLLLEHLKGCAGGKGTTAAAEELKGKSKGKTAAAEENKGKGKGKTAAAEENKGKGKGETAAAEEDKSKGKGKTAAAEEKGKGKGENETAAAEEKNKGKGESKTAAAEEKKDAE